MYEAADIEALSREILERRRSLGPRLFLPVHHYQRPEIVALGDVRGDSFGLAREAAAREEAEFIVFCGVRFMAESAAVLARPHQRVYLPDPRAGCPMADMAGLGDVERAWQVLGEQKFTPVTYMNSWAELKAFCGREGGTVCTSSNAGAVFDWALARTGRIFFFPDEHLGRNTANAKGIPPEERILWDPKKEFGGNSPDRVRKARLILWKGHCHVHTHFTVEDVERTRREHPGIRIIVHPECDESVVNASDASGSTGAIVRYVEEAPHGAKVGIGTEAHLIVRLAQENPDKSVLPISRSLCPNMFRVDLADIHDTVHHLDRDTHLIRVPEEVAAPARTALRRMLEIREAG